MDDRQPTESEDDALLTAFLAAHDAPCPRCGYNLRTLLGTRCTECGMKLRLTVGANEPYMMHWVIAVILITLPAGVGVLLAAVIIRHGTQDIFSQEWAVSAAYVAFLSAIPMTAGMLIGRRRFIRLPRLVQRLFVICFAAWALATFAIFVIAGR